MNCIAGLENITGGEILVDGEDISQASPKDRDIAMVFQSYALYPTMSVRDNIAFGLKMRKVPAAKIEEEVARVAKLLQIEPLLERKPSQLSGGQQQRVAMGGAGAAAEDLSVRRAVVEPRRQAAGGDAHRDQADAPTAENHHGVCHP